MSETLNIQQILAKYGKLIQPVKGNSMLPMLDEDKDAVELVPVKGQLKKYDLPLYQRPDGQLVLHRIIDVKKNHYLICGDNRTNIEKVPKKWIIAVASGYYKNGTYISCQDEEYISYVHQRWEDFPNRKIIRKVLNEWKVIMSLYRVAIAGREEKVKLPGILTWEMIYNQCKEQMVGAVIYPALEKVDCPESILEKFKQLNQHSLRRWLLFKAEREEIYKALDERKIPHMSLKGILYAPMYPFVGAREFADNDILIPPEYAQTVNSFMLDRGYNCRTSWVHTSYYRKPLLNFEFHTKLFQDSRIEAAFVDVWKRAKKEENSYEYRMSDEDVYLHTVAHFQKHYTDGGSGLRALADLYLLHKQGKNCDQQYIARKLEEMGLQKFAAFFEETAHQLFDGDMDAIPIDAVNYIFESGAFGNYENRAKNAIRKDGAKKYLWNRVFLPYPNMCMKYPCLRKLPVLLPVFWVVRLTDPVFNKEKRRRLKIQVAAIVKSKKNG